MRHYNRETMQIKKQEASFGFSLKPEAIGVAFVPHKSGTYYADIYGALEEAAQFSEIVLVLGMMTPDDELVLNLQSVGGSMSALDTLTHALHKTDGQVHLIASGGCHSAASMLLLEAQSFELANGFHSLIHCGSLGTGGTLAEVNSQSAFLPKFMEQQIRGSIFWIPYRT